MSEPTVLTVDQIRELLPHRFPMLLVDRVLELDDRGIVAIKLVSANEPFFQGHFPDLPIMPGVLIVEALAQAACIGARKLFPEMEGMVPVLAGVDKARFRRPVRPGEVLRLSVRFLHRRGRSLRVEGVASVEGETAANATLLAQFVEWEGRA